MTDKNTTQVGEEVLLVIDKNTTQVGEEVC